jgi:DNA-directed RNA polymerase-4 subunit 1
MLKKLDPELINQVTRRRELLFLSCLPVTPNCHRVAEMPYGHLDGPRLAFVSANSLLVYFLFHRCKNSSH